MYKKHKNELCRAAAGVALALIVVGCGRPDDSAYDEGDIDAADVPAAVTPTPNTESEMTVADLVADPMRYAGQTVTVVADVEEVLTPAAFKLDEDAVTAGGVDEDLLVLSPKSAMLNDIDDQWLNNKVRVTGTVRAMNIIEIEREIGWDMDAELEAELEDVKAVLIAKTVTRVVE